MPPLLPEPLRLGILISGNGSNLQALMDACAAGAINATVNFVLSSAEDAYGLTRARAASVPCGFLPPGDYADRTLYDAAVTRILEENQVNFVCLAGYMRILTEEFTSHWHDRLVNIHPSLLPGFKGLHTHRRALAAGVKLHGCTVHFVRAALDDGPIIIQAAVPVLPLDTEKTLAERVLQAEHRCYVEAMRAIAAGQVRVENGRVIDTSARGASASALFNPG